MMPPAVVVFERSAFYANQDDTGATK